MSKSAGKGDTYGRPRVMYGNVEICNNFNSARGCQRGRECRLAHLCLTCKGAEHSMSECAKGKKLPNSSGNQTATAPAPPLTQLSQNGLTDSVYLPSPLT